MLRTLAITAVVLLTSFPVFSQGKDNSLKGVPARERIVTGGGFGLAFSSTQDYFSVSPVIGYQFTTKLVGGSGFTYRYTKYKFYNPALKLHDYSLNPFLRYTIVRNIFAQVEYEYLNYEFPLTTKESVRKDFSSFMAGGGFIQPIGGKLFLYVMALYNFSYHTPAPGQYAPYDSPLVLRAGVNIGNLQIF